MLNNLRKKIAKEDGQK